MPYRTKRRGKRSYTRKVARKRSSARASYGRRTYRKSSRSGRSRMTKRRILNMTARKKVDNMISYSNVTAASPQGSGTYYNTGAVMPATQTYVFPWCATARNLDTGLAAAKGTVSDTATRTSQTCFMRGLSENVEIQTSDGLPWQWRRICFTFKGTTFTNGITGTGQGVSIETSSGYVRVVNTAYGANTIGVIQGTLFRGAAGVDWSSIMVAPTDTTNISIKYDKTRTIAAGNEDGMIRNYRMWHPMNKNLVYNDDEQGGTEAVSAYSTTGKPGMGDYYVVDIFQPRVNGSTSSQLRFEPSARLYWHEK